MQGGPGNAELLAGTQHVDESRHALQERSGLRYSSWAMIKFATIVLHRDGGSIVATRVCVSCVPRCDEQTAAGHVKRVQTDACYNKF